MTDDTLISAKQPDGFTHESPIRAFTSFQVSGYYAIGKGFRPSLAHLSRYLDAMETREGWRLVQIILAVNDEGDPTIVFHKVPRLRLLISGPDGEMKERTTAVSGPVKDGGGDPINPKHYGGTVCAEIGERLSANSYQILKYNWRLGGKDDEKIEIGKAIWYLDREMELAREGWRPIVLDTGLDGHFRKLLLDQPEWTQIVAKTLMSWNTYGNIETLKGLRRKLLSHKSMRTDDDGITTGMAV